MEVGPVTGLHIKGCATNKARGRRGRADGQEGGRWVKGEGGGHEEVVWGQVSVGDGR